MRVPADLYDQIVELATYSRRSISAQIIFMVERQLEDEEREHNLETRMAALEREMQYILGRLDQKQTDELDDTQTPKYAR